MTDAVRIFAALILVAGNLSGQTPGPREIRRADRDAPAMVSQAIRATHAPIIDGSDAEEIWQRAPVIEQFRQAQPAEDGEPTFRTTVRVAFDDRHLFVFVRAYDPHPDSIVRLLSRRDVGTNSDEIRLIVDAYHDRRTGVAMAVNPAGVKRDAAIYQDVTEDLSWDGIWDVATRVDSLGWTAEFQVPFSQLRFADSPTHTFGFGVWRYVGRFNEQDTWPLYRGSRQALASQLGDLQGVDGIGRAGRLELLPFISTKNVPQWNGAAWSHPQKVDAGLDFKYGLKENLTLSATLNPDFGQVEADPAVLNLTAFEIRFDERRPFFQEGVGLFKCQPCQGLIYTRRIGRSPQLRADPSDPATTTILGATKLTGRLSNGLSIGVIDAATQRETGSAGTTIEPETNYFVARVVRDRPDGRSSLGMLVTSVDRALDADSRPFLRRDARTAVVDGFQRFAHDAFEIDGYAAAVRVEGSPEAIARTQLNPVHLYQRPDGDVSFDSTRTSLSGRVFSLTAQKISGIFRFNTYLRDASPGMEPNDLGLVPLVGDKQIHNEVILQSLRPASFYRQAYGVVETENHWTSGGLPAFSLARLHGGMSLHNSIGMALTYTLQNYGAAYCVACARGGPALRQSPNQSLQFNGDGDPRRVVIPHLELYGWSGDVGRSSERRASGSVDVRLANRFSMSLGASASHRIDDQQWIANDGDPLSDTTHYTFARLLQSTVSLTSRASWTATPTLSLQLYAEPFVSTGAFGNWREIDRPRAARYVDRYASYGGGAVPDGFNVKQYNSNVVLRWEYAAGSTLYLVWQQGRQQDSLNPGTFEFARDYRDLFRAHPENTVLLKVSYWFNP
jgi:uncharacterized protein DUF5916